MLKEAPKLHVVMDNWLSIIKDARDAQSAL